jgi:TIR domain/Pentapeptide repeats (8 copies)
MTNREHRAKIREGVAAWNDWRKSNTEIVPDLIRAILLGTNFSRANLFRANLPEANLDGADFFKANLREANLDGASLFKANLCQAHLSGAHLSTAHLSTANFSEADLTGTDLGAANLTRADLTGANLDAANFNKADLTGADFTGAILGYTIFGDNDLSDVKGLDAVQHRGPSTIGIDTIYRSHGNIPLRFLRGAGVPDNFIEYMGSLTGKALEFYSCFISYSTKDQQFADRLHADLQNQGVRCWFAPHDIQAGKKIHEQIDAAIRMHEKLLLILSTNSMNSEWVKTEIRKARKRERTEKKRVLFPVRLVSYEAIRDWELFDADEGKDLAVEIREYFIPDFSDWKNHDSYAKGFRNLLRDLKAGDSKAA